MIINVLNVNRYGSMATIPCAANVDMTRRRETSKSIKLHGFAQSITEETNYKNLPRELTTEWPPS